MKRKPKPLEVPIARVIERAIVDRSTLHRWIKDAGVPSPRRGVISIDAELAAHFVKRFCRSGAGGDYEFGTPAEPEKPLEYLRQRFAESETLQARVERVRRERAQRAPPAPPAEPAKARPPAPLAAAPFNDSRLAANARAWGVAEMNQEFNTVDDGGESAVAPGRDGSTVEELAELASKNPGRVRALLAEHGAPVELRAAVPRAWLKSDAGKEFLAALFVQQKGSKRR